MEFTIEELLKIEWLIANYGHKMGDFAIIMIKVQELLQMVTPKKSLQES